MTIKILLIKAKIYIQEKSKYYNFKEKKYRKHFYTHQQGIVIYTK